MYQFIVKTKKSHNKDDGISTMLEEVAEGLFAYYSEDTSNNMYSNVDIAYASFIERFQIFLQEMFNYDITSGRPKLGKWIEPSVDIKTVLACLIDRLSNYGSLCAEVETFTKLNSAIVKVMGTSGINTSHQPEGGHFRPSSITDHVLRKNLKRHAD
ncbi:Protein IN2-1 -like protein B [Capsicum chinense]|nr:Protein IN2-1 -like protein B [Capsicum chinense]